MNIIEAKKILRMNGCKIINEKLSSFYKGLTYINKYNITCTIIDVNYTKYGDTEITYRLSDEDGVFETNCVLEDSFLHMIVDNEYDLCK